MGAIWNRHNSLYHGSNDLPCLFVIFASASVSCIPRTCHTKSNSGTKFSDYTRHNGEILPLLLSSHDPTHQQSTFSNPFVEAEEGCRKLARSSSSRETGQSSSALEVWYCYIVRHSVRLIGHLLLFCWGVWTPCTTPRPGLRVFRSAFSFDHVISTLILDVGALYIELVPVPCIQACIMYYCTYLQVKKVWSDVPQRSIGSWSLLPWASCSSLFADLSLRLSLLVPSPD